MKIFSKKTELPLVPLKDLVVFPGMIVPFFVGRKKSIQAVETANKQGRLLFVAPQKDTAVEEPGETDIYNIGTIVHILQMLKLPDGTIRLLVEGSQRAKILKYLQKDRYLKVNIKPIDNNHELTSTISALMRNITREFNKYSNLYKKIPSEIINSIDRIETPNKLVDTIAANIPLKIEKKVELLSESSTGKRLELCINILISENEVLQLENRINDKVRKKLEKTQKEYFLNEQLKEIQKELGADQNDPSGAKELEKRLKDKNLPEDVWFKCEKELKRLSRMQPISPESAVLRTYLEWIADLPWKESTQDNKNIDIAQKRLDEDHYDLKKVKERVLDFIAVRQLKGKVKGPILCFVGPPGTGKTSLGRSVARSLDRDFVRISLGGVRDEAEIRGHRKTYVGALPGKIIQSMKKAGTRNPVFLLDEIDKMSADFRGDPASALLEVLDPEQNSTFVDHYLEVQYDLSDVMFITTANSVHNIPYALRDRMEVINIPGYTEYEKQKIAEQFLITKQLTENGLEWADIKFHKTAILNLIRFYTMEAGVRNLEREIANILRKIARKAVKAGINEETSTKTGKQFRIQITAKSLKKYLGKEMFHETMFCKDTKPGLAYGLAWTEAGGMMLAVEVAILEGKGELLLTGSLGDVMKESAQTALSFLRAHAGQFDIAGDFTRDKDIHVHVPEGAIPKDGPSAGITITSALLSAVTGIPLIPGYAMTGEVTLTGRILPIGGVKEKVLAAHRNKMNHLLMPELNRKDIEELPKEVLASIDFVFADSIMDALDELFPPNTWKERKEKEKSA
ncbi:MAG: endopeptidase La [Spirochaetes bacterium]|nr:endopeptidase La [Spirochaetota bacterium]